jgi:hypothetical protein
LLFGGEPDNFSTATGCDFPERLYNSGLFQWAFQGSTLTRGSEMKELLILSRILDEIDGDSFETLEGRITFQKRVYMLQAAGMNLGYRFAWDQFGPYCKELAQDGTALDTNRDEIKQAASELVFKKPVQAMLVALKGALAKPTNSAISQAAWLELLSSLHFLSNDSRVSLDDDASYGKVIADLVSRKPYFQQFAAEQQEARLRLAALTSPA